MYDTILVPVDGSDPATDAVEAAVSLSRAVDATLSVLAVLEPTLLVGETASANPSPEDLDQLTTAATEHALSMAADAGIDCEITVAKGTPHEEITARAREGDADLIAMGAQGRTSLSRALLGSVTERTLRTSDVPVLTVRESEAEWSVDDVVVPTDGSDFAAAAADQAYGVASACDATLHAITVVEPMTLATAYATGSGLPSVAASLKEQSGEDAEAVCERAAERGLDCETTVSVGRPREAISEYAEEHSIDLIAMGTHGRTSLNRVLLGSVTERTVREGPAPVLAVPGSID